MSAICGFCILAGLDGAGASISKKFPMIGSPILQLPPCSCGVVSGKATIPYSEVRHITEDRCKQTALCSLQLDPCLVRSPAFPSRSDAPE